MPAGPDQVFYQVLQKLAQVGRLEGLPESSGAMIRPMSQVGVVLQRQAVALLENKLKEDTSYAAVSRLLVCLLLPGTSIESDVQRAMQLLHASTDSGDQAAQFNLGLIFFRGKHGVEQG